ncbi:heavy metal sensor histidine kinase [Burkholderia sp. PAMC 26561]|uniref:heavy metal sensor histidine kinase n=1 Tax=Burkholderia sp. PAMC 26561 TaxID=1795043 RepID=UPI00076B1475|nr:heavy metal sensor histidine kinase [Burkholderia sp. PAMC 26561]AME26981.1 histidine kinase [Burkholderia sp. PAMC 26561]AME27873.1 histidine kinase [Burkholderia sp. PAMC 26561]
MLRRARSRSLTATLALVFAGTTLAVFALVGSYVYLALAHEVRTQDDLDIVLATRHTRRLVEELADTRDLRMHDERIESQVLGNEALSVEVLDAEGQVLLQHNRLETADRLSWPPDVIAASRQITAAAIVERSATDKTPFRRIAAMGRLADGSDVTIIVTRNMHDRWLLLDQYRDRLRYAGTAGVLIAFLMSYLLVRRALSPLRAIARSAENFTVDNLASRIKVGNVPQELQTLVVSLNTMFAGFEQGFNRLSGFTADLAHDMRTPLANLRGATEVALARPRSCEDYQAVLASNLEESDRLSRMIENVLFLARAEHPNFAKHTLEFSIGDELLRIAEYFEGIADEAGVHLQVSGGGRLCADVELFRRAVSNLLANAVRYTPRAGKITLDAKALDGMMRVSVTNQGVPLDPALIERVFDRFYRADPSRAGSHSTGGSTGLGLAIVRTIMELHGGRAHAESECDATRFVLTFPLTKGRT